MKSQKPTPISLTRPHKDGEDLSPTSPIKSPEQRNPYKHFQILGKLCDSSFSLFLTYSENFQRNFIMKAFPYINNEINRHFLCEARLHDLAHQNVVRLYDVQKLKKGYSDTKKIYISYVLMEYAPHGDFCEMLMKRRLPKDEKVARTYVHQLVEGVEYLHSKGIYHMDLKLDNLLVGDDYTLKISDFDSCFCKEDKEFLGTGSEDYRAPEVKSCQCRDPVAADVYSIAIIMFTLTFHSFPYSEERKIRGFDLFDTLINKPETFWDTLSAVHGKGVKGSSDFNDIFMALVKKDPVERATLNDLKQSEWYNGPTYTTKELRSVMNRMYTKAKSPSSSSPTSKN